MAHLIGSVKEILEKSIALIIKKVRSILPKKTINGLKFGLTKRVGLGMTIGTVIPHFV